MKRSLNARFLLVLISAGLLCSVPVSARLGETEAQSEARYGKPKPELITASDKPLMPGAKEAAYQFEGWRIRAAFVNNVTHRIEYAKIPGDGGLKKLQPAEIEAILEAEKGLSTYRWKEQKPKTGLELLDKLKETFDGKVWRRSDNAEAKLLLEILLVLETRDAERLEKQLAKAAAKTAEKTATPTPKVPKF